MAVVPATSTLVKVAAGTVDMIESGLTAGAAEAGPAMAMTPPAANAATTIAIPNRFMFSSLF
jgi:hypothetical protein